MGETSASKFHQDEEMLPSGPELVDAVQHGEVTSERAAQLLQQAARRHAADEGPDLDTDADGAISLGGHGSGQGMEKQRTGQ